MILSRTNGDGDDGALGLSYHRYNACKSQQPRDGTLLSRVVGEGM